MELILWRHADAEDPGPRGDFARELTKKGRKQAEAMAAWLRPRLEGEWRIVCSPAARAIQTVTALGRDYEVAERLDPGHGGRDMLETSGWPKGSNTLLVGHNPTLGEVAAELMGGRGGEVVFRKGAVWWFATRERGGAAGTVLKVVIDPDML